MVIFDTKQGLVQNTMPNEKWKQKLLALTVAALCVGALSGCNNDNDDDVGNNTPNPVATGDLLVLTSNGQLASFNRNEPSKLISQQAISGLRSGDSVVGIDYRPADGKLYAVGHLGNIYTINPSTSQAEFKSALSADSTDTTTPYAGITGDQNLISVDFNPVADRLRVITNSGQSLRINVDTGATTTDGSVAAPAVVTSAAYTNSFVGTGSTKLFDIDVGQNRVYLQNPPNDGTLAEFANLGVDPDGSSGFDIDGVNNQGYAVLTVGGATKLYKIDLSTVGTASNAISDTNGTVLPNGLSTIRGLALKPANDAGATVLGLSTTNQLITFKANKPTEITATTSITGLLSNETIIGIDYRSRTSVAGKAGLLYGLSNLGNLYIINPTSGAASSRVTLNPNAGDGFISLSGNRFAVDFNPVADRLRVVSNTGQNLRINVDTGATITDGSLNSVSNPDISAGAYTNSFSSGSATALFNLDRTSNRLLQQNPPNNGTLVSIGNLGISLGLNNAFDIAGGDNGLALAATTGSNAFSTLYKINLATGAATPAISVNGTASVDASRIGTGNTPALIDLAIWLK